MELAINIAGEFLDLNPGTFLELEEENPFLQVGNGIQGEYTMPFTVPASEKNMRMLGLPHLHYISKRTEGMEAIVYVGGVQHSRGRVKIETGQGNLNNPNRGVINLYYLYGLSDFWKTVENKYLSDCEYGQDISYPFSTEYTGNGFFAHLTAVMNAPAGAYEYAFLPVLNTAGLVTAPDKPGIYAINNVTMFIDTNKALPAQWSVRQDWTSKAFRPKNEFCPFPYLHLVIRRIFASFGFLVKGEILNNADFQKAVLLHNNYIDWVTPSKGPGILPVSWNMRNMVPKVKVGTFIMALCNRLGWWLDFDYRNKVVTIKHRRNILQGRKKREITNGCSATYNFTTNKEGKIYSLVTPGGVEKINFDSANFKGNVGNRYQLPTAAENRENNIYFLLGENSYFFCTQNEDGQWLWVKSGDNTFNYIVSGASEEISTNCLVPDSDTCPFGPNIWAGGGDHFPKRMVVPVVTLTQDETETFYIAYNFGIVKSINDRNSPENWSYPMAGVGCHDLYGNLKVSKSLAFEYPETDTLDRGIYKNEWQYFLSLLQQREELTIPVGVVVTDVLGIEYTDTVVIKGVEYFIKNPHFTLPVKNYSNMELVRVFG